MKHFLKTAAFLLLMQVPLLLTAQPEFDDDVNDVPLDGGISALIFAGAAYGAKKAYDYKKNQKADSID